MQKIALPQNIEFQEGSKPEEAIIAISPCFPGYGITLGNAVRRVMLSSLPGAAVIGVKIKGASHEFMSLPHVKEDVLRIILNLKKLRLKIHSEETIKLELEAHGVKEVKASDIKPDAQVEIANPDLILAHLTDAAGRLEMEIFVAAGRGYEMTESREIKQKEADYIDIDSIFSPVINVSIDVENIRVGKMTNWDKLTLAVVTDGTITPKEAFERSVEILIEQFNSLTGKNEAVPAAEEAEEEKVEVKAETEPEEEKAVEKEEKPKKKTRKKKEE